MTTKTPSLLRRPSNENDIRPFDATTAHVVMQDGGTVLVDLDALADLERRGVTGRWYEYANGSGRSYVAAHLPSGGTTTVASLIAKRLPGEGVSYANGNRRDLRRLNLVVSPRGRGRRKAWQAHAAALFPNDTAQQVQWLQRQDQRRVQGTEVVPEPRDTLRSFPGFKTPTTVTASELFDLADGTLDGAELIRRKEVEQSRAPALTL